MKHLSNQWSLTRAYVLVLKDPIDIEQFTTGIPYIGTVSVDYFQILVVITNKKEK